MYKIIRINYDTIKVYDEIVGEYSTYTNAYNKMITLVKEEFEGLFEMLETTNETISIESYNNIFNIIVGNTIITNYKISIE